jgi:hypothetical protein
MLTANGSRAATQQCRVLLIATAASLVVFALSFMLIATLDSPAQGYWLPTLLAVALAFGSGYRAVTYYRRTLSGCLLSCLIIPTAYILVARLMLADARDGWGALAYIWGTVYAFAAGNLGVLLGLIVIRRSRHPA